MDPAAGGEGEVLRAGHSGDRDEAIGDDASGYNSPAGGSSHGDVGRDCTRSSGRPVRKRTKPAQGSPVCTEYHGRALKVQELWHAQARKLNIPLSAKGHPVGQSGAFTGVAIDSFQGQFSMLPDKMALLVAARQELAASEVSTPRLIARVRGKALHYGCAIPFIAVAAPSLSQLMHGRETGARYPR